MDTLFGWLWSSPESKMEKNGKLLSKVLSENWPAQANEEELLKYLLTWPPTSKYLKLEGNLY